MNIIEFAKKFFPDFKLLPYQYKLLEALKKGEKISLDPSRRTQRREIGKLTWLALIRNPPYDILLFGSREKAEEFMVLAKKHKRNLTVGFIENGKTKIL